jgi:uncharacterized membrane protein
MASHESSIDVNVPFSTAFEEWTDYPSFPRFMEDVHAVHALDDGRIRWRATLGSRPREWDAEVDTDREGGRVSWRSVSGAQHDGEVVLTAKDDTTTTVRLRMEYDSDGLIEGAGAAAKAVRSRVDHGLRAFKRYAEELEAGRREAEEAASGRSRARE